MEAQQLEKEDSILLSLSLSHFKITTLSILCIIIWDATFWRQCSPPSEAGRRGIQELDG